ncbi:MAG: hypothetical protein AAGA77_25685 [Bacteroidota bacterium]
MHTFMLNPLPLIIVLFSFTASAHSQTSSNTHHHDFDFWIGSWTVYKYGTDTIVGLSEIKPILNHRAIEENYQGWQNPFRGTSNNIYNAQKNQWEQHWVDNSGLALFITGGLEADKMVLSNCNGDNCIKIIWSPLAQKTVRQEWLVSQDGGANWKKVFDGHYMPREKDLNVVPVLTHLTAYPNIRDFTISSDGKEAYLTVQNPTEEIRTICRIQKSNGVWSKPYPTPFSGKHKDLEPYLSPDNLKLFFVSNRPNAFDKENYDIYYVERDHVDSTWSEPINLGAPINTEGNEFYPAIAASGNLYFTSVKAKDNGRDDIYFSAWNGNQYSEPVSMDTTINTTGYEFNSFISPDESYIIFSGYNRADGLGSGDMYISYKNESEQWTQAQNLSSTINSKYMDYCPYVDNNGTLYFTSRRNSASDMVIQNNFHLEQETMKYQNGQSRIYKVKLSSL